MTEAVSIFWFRRDLRLEDNAGLYQALHGEYPVLPVFIFDKEILDDLQDKADKRVCFIYDTVKVLKQELEYKGHSLLVLYGKPEDCYRQILRDYNVKAVYTNHDYEPYAQDRDAAIARLLQTKDVPFHSYKDQVIFEKNEVLKDNGEPYTVYTPYSKKWKAKLNDFYLRPYPTKKYSDRFLVHKPFPFPALKDIGFEKTTYDIVPAELNSSLLNDYEKARDIPALDATTHLSIHLRFGTISIRKLVRDGLELKEKFVDELIWREFYQMILWHFPQVVDHSFKPEYDKIKWRNNEKEFELWCSGNTGFPIVDAGMRELNETGYMHNRVRMIVASFLTKDLLIDWRWGEAYFAQKAA